MNKCKLCLENEANQTGSHIIPFFLLKKVDNLDNSKKRGKELGFVIGPMETKSYFGSGVLPDRLEEIYGSLSDDEIDNLSKSPFIKDNIFCRDCEKRISVVESEYSKSIDKDNFKSQTPLLFWLSVFWRVSISNTSNFKFNVKQENEIRNYLNGFFNNNIIEEKDVSFCYKVMRCDSYTKPLINLFHPIHTQPYCFIIANYVIFFYFKNSYLKLNPPMFFGFDKGLKNVPISNCKGENVQIIQEQFFAENMDKINQFQTNKRTKSFNAFLDIIFGNLEVLNRDYLKGIIFNKMATSDEKISVSSGFEHLTSITLEVLREHGMIRD